MNERPKQQLPRRSTPRLPAGARWAARGLVALPLVCLTVSAGVYCASVYHLLHAHLIPIAEAELTRQTGHEVRIGSANFNSHSLVLGDIAISNKATFAAGNGEATLTARRVTVDYNLHSLIFDSGNAAHALGDVTIEQPSLLVERLSSTRYNFSDFFKPKTKKVSKPFVGRVLVHHGLLRFRDFDAPDRGKRPALNTLAGVEGTVDFGSTRNVYFDVRGTGTNSRFATLLINGDVSREFAGRYRGHVVAADADVAYWTDYFKAFKQARIVTGRGDADVSIAKLGAKPPPGLPLDLSGRIVLRRTTVLVSDKKLLRLPLENLNGTAVFTGSGVSLDASVMLGGQPLAAAGTIFDFAHPQVAVTVKSPALDPITLARAVPALTVPAGIHAGRGPVTASFTGTVASPTITINASLPSVEYLGNQLTALTASATYAGKILSVPSATFKVNGTGSGAIRATVDTSRAKPVVLLAGAVSGFNLADLHLPVSENTKRVTLGGLANVQFIADNLNQPLSVAADIQVQKPRVLKTALNSLAGRVTWTLGQPVTIVHAALQAGAGQGAAAVSGTIPAGVKNGQWNLTLRTAGLDLASLLRPYSVAVLSGRAAFDGKITGPANAPSASGAARLIEPHFGRFSADLVSGNITASQRSINFQAVTVRRFPTLAGLDGSISDLMSGNPKLAFNVRLSQGDVSDFLNLAEQASAPSLKTAHALAVNLPNLTGTAEGAFRVGGSLKSPTVYGHAVVSDATVASYRLDQVAANLRYENGVLSIANGLVKSGDATVSAHGTRTASGIIRADFKAVGLDLTRFYQALDPLADIQGTAAFSGSFSGTPQAPHVVVRALDLPDLSVNNQKFSPLTLAGRYDDGIFTQTGAPWQFTVAVPTDYAAEPGGQVEYEISRLRLTLPTATRPKRPKTLALSAAIPAFAPERLSHIFRTIRQTRWAQTDEGKKFLVQLARLPQPLSGTFALPSVSVSGPLNDLTAKVEFSADDLIFGETKIAGLTARAEYKGGADPSGQVTASAHDLLAAGVPIGAASLDAAYSHRTITLHSLKATSSRAFVSASGTANLDGDIAASVDASNIPLALFRSSFPSASPYLNLLPSEISELSVNATGPTRSPNYVGSISLSNPESAAALVPGSAPPPVLALDRIRSGTITVASATPDGPKVLTVSTLSAFKNGRLIATLSGTLPLALGDLTKVDAAVVPDQNDLHADLKVQDLSALTGFSSGLLDAKKTAGQLTASANFGGGRLSGLINLTDASVGLTSFDTYANKINGIVVLADNKAVIQSFSGQSSKGGTFSLSGGATFADSQTVSLQFAAKDLTLDEVSKQNFLYQKFSSGLKAKVNGAVSMVGPWLTPRIATPPNAPIVISDASGTLPSASNAAAVPGKPSAFDPSFAVAVQLGGGRTKTVTVSNALLKADAGGLVQLGGTFANPQIKADLTVAKGQFTLPPSTVLKIVKPVTGDANTVSASYPFIGTDGLPGLRTRVDLYAQATVTPSEASLAQYRSVASGNIGESAPSVSDLSTTPFGGTRQRYTITAHIYGVLNSPDQLTLDLTSSPGGLTRQQMLAALVPASALLASGGSDLETGFKQALVSAALSPLTSTLGDALGLQDLNVSYDPNQPLFVTVTKALGPRLNVTFSRSFGARGTTETSLQPPQYTLQLGYDLTRRLRAGVSTDDQNNKTVTLETVLQF
ncbi:MAG: DUF748 domain-containing protein [Janthinobacterium lividum]